MSASAASCPELGYSYQNVLAYPQDRNSATSVTLIGKWQNWCLDKWVRSCSGLQDFNWHFLLTAHKRNKNGKKNKWINNYSNTNPFPAPQIQHDQTFYGECQCFKHKQNRDSLTCPFSSMCENTIRDKLIHCQFSWFKHYNTFDYQHKIMTSMLPALWLAEQSETVNQESWKDQYMMRKKHREYL